MDGIIEVKINGSYLTKDCKHAGVQHEANAKSLRIEFDPSWDEYAKTVTFWNALMEDPVKRVLTTDLLEDATKSTRIYVFPIPGEPLKEAGELTFIVDGYIEGKRQRSLETALWVDAAPICLDAGQPADPTPTQAEQLQVEIDTIKGTIQQAVHSAQEAKQSEQASAASAEEAQTSAQTADQSAQAAAESAQAAQGAKTAAEVAQAGTQAAQVRAETAQDAAEAAQTGAEAAKAGATAAQTAAENAKTAAVSAQLEAESAKSAAQSAQVGAETAKTGAEAAREGAAASAAQAAQSAQALESGSKEAKSWAVGGTGTREGEDTNNAKYWCENAQAAAGGGVTSFQGRFGAVTAQMGDYDAAMVGADPQGTAASAVAAHNENGQAHADLRAALEEKADLGEDGKVLGAQLPALDYVPNSQKGAASGVATLGEDGKVPGSQLSIASTQPPIVTTEGTGEAYTAQVPGITELYNGLMITIIPHTISTSTTPTLDVNGLGAKVIRRYISSQTVGSSQAMLASWLRSGRPILLQYNGTNWVALGQTQPNATDLLGTVPIASGGTGATTAKAARTNLEITAANTPISAELAAQYGVADTPNVEAVLAGLDVAPAYSYGTADLTAGTSSLETGKLYFVYE